jgi:hypothetical protein
LKIENRESVFSLLHFFVLLNIINFFSFSLLERLLFSPAAEPQQQVVKSLRGVRNRPADLTSKLRREGHQEQVGEGVEGLYFGKEAVKVEVFFCS